MRIRLLASTITALTLCAIVGTQAYVLNVAKWGTSQVPYYINPVNQDVSESAATAAVQAGLATWGAQSNANFSFYYMGRTSGTSFANNGKNEIFFRNADAGSTVAEAHWWYDGSNRLIDADIMFYDGGITFFTGSSGCSGGLYIEDVAAHESGHALGLGHSSVSTATMAPSMDWCTTGLRSLDADDLAGVERLYPPVGGSTTTNTAPTVSITSPATSLSFPAGTAITFTGVASDREDGALSARIVWTSNLAGQFGLGASITKALSAGIHTITATVTDSAGMRDTATVVVIITAVLEPPTNTAPNVSITAPATNLSFPAGSGITFTGVASDPEDGALSTRIVWTSNLAGQFGLGAIVTKGLSAGIHTITAAVTDSAGMRDTATVVVIVTEVVAPTTNTAPTVSITLTVTTKVGSYWRYVYVNWTGVTGSQAEIYRDGVKVTTAANDGAAVFAYDPAISATQTYRVCAVGTSSTCSSFVLVEF